MNRSLSSIDKRYGKPEVGNGMGFTFILMRAALRRARLSEAQAKTLTAAIPALLT